MKTIYMYVDGNSETVSIQIRSAMAALIPDIPGAEYIDDGSNLGYNMSDKFLSRSSIIKIISAGSAFGKDNNIEFVIGLYDHNMNVSDDIIWIPDPGHSLDQLCDYVMGT